MNAQMESRVMAHGVKLLRIFPDCTERRPVELCRKLRRLEAEAHAVATHACNGTLRVDEEASYDRVLDRLDRLLAFRSPNNPVPVFINRDPRGYALKIDDEWMREHDADLYRDWGGYGILAPDLTDA